MDQHVLFIAVQKCFLLSLLHAAFWRLTNLLHSDKIIMSVRYKPNTFNAGAASATSITATVTATAIY